MSLVRSQQNTNVGKSGCRGPQCTSLQPGLPAESFILCTGLYYQQQRPQKPKKTKQKGKERTNRSSYWNLCFCLLTTSCVVLFVLSVLSHTVVHCFTAAALHSFVIYHRNLLFYDQTDTKYALQLRSHLCQTVWSAELHFFSSFWVTGELSTLRQMMKVPSKPGLLNWLSPPSISPRSH